jgi:hypothetical protein
MRMLEQPEPFNFYTFSPLFILAFFITHGKQEIGECLSDFFWDYDITAFVSFTKFMQSRSEATFFVVFFVTLLSSLFFMLWRFDVYCDKQRAYEAQERKRSN